MINKNVISYLTLSLGLVFSSLQLIAQSEVKWGPAYKKQGGIFAGIYLLGLDGDQYYVLNKSGNKVIFLTYGLDHRLLSTKTLNYKYGRRSIAPIEIISTSAGKFAHFPVVDKKTNSWKIFISKFDQGIASDPKEVFNHEYRGGVYDPWVNKAYGLNGLNEIDISANKSTVGFVNVENIKEKGSLSKLVLAVFDENMNLLWNKAQQFNYKSRHIEFLQMIVSNTSDVFVLAKIFDVKSKEKNLPGYRFVVFKISPDAIVEYDARLENNFQATDAGLFLTDSENKLVLGGFYTSNLSKNNNLTGTFFTEIALNTKEIKMELTPFDKLFLQDYLNEKSIEKGKGISDEFFINNFISHQNGTFSFIAENRFSTVKTTTDSDGRMTSSTTYHSHNLMIPRFSAEGKMEFIVSVDKFFRSTSSLITSYALAVSNSKTYLLFNDTKTRDERKKIATPNGKSASRYTDMLVLDKEGKIEKRKTIFSSETMATEFLPFMSKFSNKVFLIGGRSGKTYQFGTLTLE